MKGITDADVRLYRGWWHWTCPECGLEITEHHEALEEQWVRLAADVHVERHAQRRRAA